MINNKLVFLPYCAVNLRDLIASAEQRSLSVEVLDAEESVLRIIREKGIKYVVGVCCQRKINDLTPHAGEVGISGYKAVPAGGDEECFKITKIKRDVNIKDYVAALDWLCGQ